MDSPFRLPPSAFAARLRWLLLATAALSLTVYGRLIALEAHDGDNYRAAGDEPIVRRQTIHAIRGRILARDGTVLAADEPVVALAVNYRWLEEPANPRWLRQTARARLTPRERRDAKRVAAEQDAVLQERRQLAERLARMCAMSEAEWQRRARRIQRRVESIAAGVNARHGILQDPAASNTLDRSESGGSLVELAGRSIVDALFALDAPPPAASITIVEQISEHVMFEGLPMEAIAEIESQPRQYPGVKLVRTYRRAYPAGDLAAQVLGYVGSPEQRPLESNEVAHADWIGRSGIERQCETVVRAIPGSIVERLDPRGRVKSSFQECEAAAGRDVVLTIDPKLQQVAETLLDEALRRRLPSGDDRLDLAAGGAVVVLDVNNGDVLAAATAPRFDPNAFVQGNSSSIQSWLNDPGKPLFDRAIQMALPPGSVFKIVTAAAILNAGVNPRAPVDCQGYLHQPEALRCAIFRRLGIGHGPVTLADALARSCNVYFFHHAEQLGAVRLVDWAQRFGLGQRTGIDLAGEAAGSLPKIPKSADESSIDNRSLQMQIDARPISIGQSTIAVTPLQMARVAAAIANGGRLVTPHLVDRGGAASNDPPDSSPPRLISGLNAEVSAAIRSGLRQAVADEQGTAQATVEFSEVAIAGKTGTAETGGGQPDHAWFVGYAPAENPRVAFAVAIEYGGDGAVAAGPVAKHLVVQMNELGYVGRKN